MKTIILYSYYFICTSIYTVMLFTYPEIAGKFGAIFLSLPTLIGLVLWIFTFVPCGTSNVNDSRPPSVSGL